MTSASVNSVRYVMGARVTLTLNVLKELVVGRASY